MASQKDYEEFLHEQRADIDARLASLSDVNFKRDLGMARDYIGMALDALADEHEGNFKHFTTQASGLLAKVKNEAEAM